LGTRIYDDYRYPRAGYYDFSDEGAVNIKVSVWGYVERPGKYVIPDYSTVYDLLSFAGGPNQNAEMDDLRIYRTLENGNEEMIKFNFDDILWGEKIEVNHRFIPKLEPSDILVVPGSPRYFFKDWFNLGLQIVSVVASLLNIYLLITYIN
jgi:protein involved in polysaccharide export with SLBB domain